MYVVAEVDREALGGADLDEELTDPVGVDASHRFASHHILIPRRRLENCGTSASQIRTGLGYETQNRVREGHGVDDLDGLFESIGLDVAVERGEEVLDGYWLHSRHSRRFLIWVASGDARSGGGESTGNLSRSKRVVDWFLAENTGKRAAILDFVGCQRGHNFVPRKTGTGQIGPWKRLGSPWEAGLLNKALQHLQGLCIFSFAFEEICKVLNKFVKL